MKYLSTVVACFCLAFGMAACKGNADGIKAFQDGKEIKMGRFVEGKLSGLGLMASEPNDIESIGSWKGGAIDGLGLRVNKIYTDIGEFKNGAMNGKGMKKSTTGDVYIGNFVNDNYQGKGVLYYADGRVYSGSFLNNLPEGLGTMQSPGGNTYIGAFKNGMYDGQGLLLLGNGKRWEGKFANNEPSITAKFYEHH